MTKKLKVISVVGIRPMITKLATNVNLRERHTNQVLAHTGQTCNYEFISWRVLAVVRSAAHANL